MPNYTYRCPVCGREKDINVPLAFREVFIAECHNPQHSEPVDMDRVPSAPAFTVRGGTPRFYK